MLREGCVRPAACGVRRAACWLRVVEGACVCCQWVGDSGSLGTLSLSLRKPSLWRQPRISETSLEARAERGRRCSCASCECVSLRLKRLVADGIFSISECYSIDPDRPHHGAHTCQQCGPRRVDCMRDHEPHGARAQRAVPHDPHDPGSSGRRTSDDLQTRVIHKVMLLRKEWYVTAVFVTIPRFASPSSPRSWSPARCAAIVTSWSSSHSPPRRSATSYTCTVLVYFSTPLTTFPPLWS